MLQFLQLFYVHSWFLKRFAKVLHLFVSFCNVALCSCSILQKLSTELSTKLSTEPTSTNLSDILKIKRRLASFCAKDDVGCCTITFHWWKTSFVQSDAANDNFSLMKFHRSRRWLAATKSRTIFSSLSSLWINLSTYKRKGRIQQRPQKQVRQLQLKKKKIYRTSI